MEVRKDGDRKNTKEGKEYGRGKREEIKKGEVKKEEGTETDPTTVCIKLTLIQKTTPTASKWKKPLLPPIYCLHNNLAFIKELQWFWYFSPNI